MVMAATALMTATIPMIVATGAIIHVSKVMFRDKSGKSVGALHYHFTQLKASSKAAKEHQHEGGGRRHRHTGLYGYGRSRRSLKR